MAKQKMTKQEKEEWDELYQYVKKEILGYSDEQALTPKQVLKLKGLTQGKFVFNKKTSAVANYSYKIILYTFMAYKTEILNYISGKSFVDEQHKFNGILVIVREHINDIYMRTKNAKKTQEQIHNDDVSQITHYSQQADYTKKTNEISEKQKDKFEQYW